MPIANLTNAISNDRKIDQFISVIWFIKKKKKHFRFELDEK